MPNCKSGVLHIILFSKPSSFITVRKSVKKEESDTECWTPILIFSQCIPTLLHFPKFPRTLSSLDFAANYTLFAREHANHMHICKIFLIISNSLFPLLLVYQRFGTVKLVKKKAPTHCRKWVMSLLHIHSMCTFSYIEIYLPGVRNLTLTLRIKKLQQSLKLEKQHCRRLWRPQTGLKPLLYRTNPAGELNVKEANIIITHLSFI